MIYNICVLTCHLISFFRLHLKVHILVLQRNRFSENKMAPYDYVYIYVVYSNLDVKSKFITIG